jgi:bifunctional non-homologous end joining protein LigD
LIARKHGDQVRLWTRPGSDYSARFTRITGALAALPVERAVLDGEAIVLRPDAASDFFALRSTEGQAAAVLVAFDILELDEVDLRPQPLEGAPAAPTGPAEALYRQGANADRDPAQRADPRGS